MATMATPMAHAITTAQRSHSRSTAAETGSGSSDVRCVRGAAYADRGSCPPTFGPTGLSSSVAGLVGSTAPD